MRATTYPFSIKLGGLVFLLILSSWSLYRLALKQEPTEKFSFKSPKTDQNFALNSFESDSKRLPAGQNHGAKLVSASFRYKQNPARLYLQNGKLTLTKPGSDLKLAASGEIVLQFKSQIEAEAYQPIEAYQKIKHHQNWVLIRAKTIKALTEFSPPPHAVNWFLDTQDGRIVPL